MEKKYKELIGVIVFFLIFITFALNSHDNIDKDFEKTCRSSYFGKITYRSPYGGVIVLEIDKKEKMLFGIYGNTDIFYEKVKKGHYVKKEANSPYIRFCEDSLFQKSVKTWETTCSREVNYSN
jgi:hypothetical protein